jgi:uncharacterized protein YciI
MQFLIIARDFKPEGLQRRLAVRSQHVALGDKLRASGNFLYGVAMLDDEGTMRGSTMVMDFGSKTELDAWLKTEPYVTGHVWENIEISPCAVGPTFSKEQSPK